MKTSFITTVFNEQQTITPFLKSLFQQSKMPDEIIIVDGGSTDHTISTIHYIVSDIKKTKIKVKVFIKKGNRSFGRNIAIKNATGEIILCSDAGNVLDKNWIKNIIGPFRNKKVDVVAGYYKGKPKNIFQRCLIPYVLVMPDKVNSQNFLPATRSIAFKKTIWKDAGMFDEKFSHNEDYIFARKLKKIGAIIIFVKAAIVYWIPRNSYKGAFVMFFRFALGDMESGIVRPKVVLLFARFFIIFLLFFYLSKTGSNFLFLVIIFLLLFYIVWAISKNYKYIKDKRAFVILPLLQITADFAVGSGSLIGFLKKLNVE